MRMPSLQLLIGLLLIGTLCLMFIFYKDNVPPDELSDLTQRRESTYDNRSQTPAYNISDVSMWPRCQRNESVSNMSGFAPLPGRIQDFLLHRHCRHFPMLLDVPDKCGGSEKSSDVFLLLVIKSPPRNYDQREVLRKTWAEERLQNGVWVRRIFISGTTSSGFERLKLNKLLKLENRVNNDILQWDFADTFLNLTLKQVLFLEWMDRNCPSARFLLNGDDDIFANTDNMVEYLQSLSDNDGSKHLFVGHIMRHVGPIRNEWSKYYVPVQVQESDSYPPYCSGGGFLLSGYTTMVIYNMSHSIPLLPIDDVYIGMCLEQAGLSLMTHEGIKIFGLNLPSHKLDSYNPCYYKEILLVHRFETRQIYIMWHEVHDPNMKCRLYIERHMRFTV